MNWFVVAGQGVSSEHLGRRLRAVRLARNYTIAEVAQLSGLSKSFISMLENGKTNISATRLQTLAGVFDLAVSDFLPDEHSRGLIQVVRSGEGATLQGFGDGASASLLVRDLHRRIQPVLLTLQAGTVHRNDHGHAGEEFVLILTGSADVSIDSGEYITLDEGDTAFYPSALSHVFRNSGDKPVQLLTISTPNTWFHS